MSIGIIRAFVAVLCILSFSGCATFQEGMRQAQVQEQTVLNQKRRALTIGTDMQVVRAAWGSPDRSTFIQQGADTYQVLQYGTCSTHSYIISRVIFITLANGQVMRYAMTDC